MVDQETALVETSQRFIERGARQPAEFLFYSDPLERVVKAYLPKQRAFMHLGLLFTGMGLGSWLTTTYVWSRAPCTPRW